VLITDKWLGKTKRERKKENVEKTGEKRKRNKLINKN
jgi:hypothetical protein